MKEKGGLHWFECSKTDCDYATTPGLSYSAAALAGNRHKTEHRQNQLKENHVRK